jgi:hypothetical protein
MCSTTDEREEILARVVELTGALAEEARDGEGEVTADKEEIQSRRVQLEKDKNLKMVFDAFWLCYQAHCGPDSVLTLAGYLKFHESLQHALLGERITTIIKSRALAEADYTVDTKLYGALNQVAFYDVLFETISTWSNIHSTAAYAAFGWALLECIADMKVQPPRLKPLREVNYMVMEGGEGDTIMAINFIKDKKFRLSMAKQADKYSDPKVKYPDHCRFLFFCYQFCIECRCWIKCNACFQLNWARILATQN